MIKKFKTTFILILCLTFIFLVISHYFSKKHIVYINKSRSIYSLKSYTDLPLLKNDTNNIIVYKDGLEEFNNKRKKRIWEKLISDES